MPVAPAPMTVRATTRSSRDHQLELATKTMRENAHLIGNHGILVTRETYTTFTVSLSPEVPFGQTWERDTV